MIYADKIKEITDKFYTKIGSSEIYDKPKTVKSFFGNDIPNCIAYIEILNLSGSGNDIKYALKNAGFIVRSTGLDVYVVLPEKSPESNIISEEERIIQLINYSTEGAYDRNELTLSSEVKKQLTLYVTDFEKLFKTQCHKITVMGKWNEPFPKRDSKTTYPTWRFWINFDNGMSRDVRINRKAMY